MQKDILDIKSEKLFPFHFQVFGGIVFGAGLVATIAIPLLGVVLAIIGLMTFTSYSGVQFDRVKKAYREYTSFLFVKVGKFRNYDLVEKIYVNANHVSQKVYTRVNAGTTIRNIEYDAFLKFNNGVKLFLTSGKDKKKVFDKINDVSNFFQIMITDNTI